MSAVTVALLCAGGAAGAVLRFWTARLGALLAPDLEFPLPTLFVNLTGSALLGIIFGLTDPDFLAPFSDPWLLLFGVGFCGAYTTFSSFCTETITLVTQSGKIAAIYVLTTIVGSLGAFALPFVFLT